LPGLRRRERPEPGEGEDPMKHHPEVTDDMISIFTSILIGGDANKRLASELIRKLGPEARRDLRAACQNVDNLIDDVWLEELRERRPWKL
jgi:hypothetical protein